MPRPLRIVPFFAAVAAVIWVASCGGDGGTTITPPPPPPPNQAPTAVGSIAAQTVAAGESVTVNVSSNFNDPDGDALTYTATTSDAGVATASVAGSNVTIAGVAAGTATITVTARDPDGATVTQSISVTVEVANQAPVAMGSLGELSFDQGGEVTVHVAENFSDPDGDALVYTATSSDTMVVTVTASEATVVVVGVTAGSATVTVTATDPGGLSATQDMAVMILPGNQAPVAMGSLGELSFDQGGEVTVHVAEYFRDPDGDALVYTATSSDTMVVTVTASEATVVVVGVAAGSATVTVTATDPGGLSATQDMAVMILPGNQAPVAMGSLGELSFDQGGEVTVHVAENFSDPDGDALTYTAASSDTAVVTVTTSEATVVVVGVAAGSATVTVTASDPGGLSATQDMAVMILPGNQAPQLGDSIPAQGIQVGETIMIVVSGHFTDPDGDELTFEAVSSDTGIATALASSDTVTIGGVAAGGVSVTVSASDPEGLSASQEVMVTVEQAMSNRAPTLADDSIPVPAHDLVVDSAVVLDLSGYFVDPDGDPLVYTATTSDEAWRWRSVDGSVVTTTALSAMEDTVLTVTLTVTATDPEGLSFGAAGGGGVCGGGGLWGVGGVRDHRGGQASATLRRDNPSDPIASQPRPSEPSPSGDFDVHWTEWQMKQGSGWIRAPGTRHVAGDEGMPGAGGRDLSLRGLWRTVRPPPASTAWWAR